MVLVMFAWVGVMSGSRAGKVRRVPPPAKALIPPAKPAVR
jgi:hypothetical protein